jgi:GT2 family glycosyltransferase
MTQATPKVTVIIPTHNRLSMLRQVLGALADQAYPSDRMEVIVVADGCNDGTVAALTSASFPYHLRALSQPASGAAAARNRGAEHARGSILVFLDDDVIPSPGVVAAHVRLHASTAGCVGVGPYMVELPEAPEFYDQQRHRWWQKTFDTLADPQHRPDYRDLLAGNLSVQLDTFRRSGGFNPEFSAWGAEDCEYGVRLLQQGIRIVYLPEARARHLHTTDLAGSYLKSRQRGRADVLFAQLHPTVFLTLDLGRRNRLAEILAFRAPRAGDATAVVAVRIQKIADRMRTKRLWRRLGGALRSYWYWRGVADVLGDVAALDGFWRRVRHAAGVIPPTTDRVAAGRRRSTPSQRKGLGR